MMLTKESLAPLFAVLKQFGGYFVFSDEEGNEFVITSQENFTTHQKASPSETQAQLTLPPASERPTSAIDVLDRINREIALYQMLQQEDAEEGISEEIDDLALEQPAEQDEPGLRIRFEPLRGDLPPDLQE